MKRIDFFSVKLLNPITTTNYIKQNKKKYTRIDQRQRRRTTTGRVSTNRVSCTCRLEVNDETTSGNK